MLLRDRRGISIVRHTAQAIKGEINSAEQWAADDGFSECLAAVMVLWWFEPYVGWYSNAQSREVVIVKQDQPGFTI